MTLSLSPIKRGATQWTEWKGLSSTGPGALLQVSFVDSNGESCYDVEIRPPFMCFVFPSLPPGVFFRPAAFSMRKSFLALVNKA
jgi:hypothetical protein